MQSYRFRNTKSSRLRISAHLLMSLSLNWKNLSSRIEGARVEKPKSRKKKTKLHATNHKAPTDAPALKPTSKSTALPPIAYALWSTPSGSPVLIPQDKKQRVVPNYDDIRKSAPGKFLAIDCEFVGVGPDEVSALARVSIVNYFGKVMLDTFVKPKQRVTNWRTWVSGVSPYHMHNAITFEEARTKVLALITSETILVGHAIQNDLKSLEVSHPLGNIRDTSRYSEFRKLSNGKQPALKKLALHYLHVEIQAGEHSSVEDAQVTMALFRLHQKQISQEWASKHLK